MDKYYKFELSRGKRFVVLYGDYIEHTKKGDIKKVDMVAVAVLKDFEKIEQEIFKRSHD